MAKIELTPEQYEELIGNPEVNTLADFIGKKLFIRTVTYHLVGQVVGMTGDLFELRDASWVADSGRFTNALRDGTLSEVEPVGRCWVSLAAIVDMFPWVHALPDKQK